MNPCASLSHARPLWLRSARAELLLFGVFALLLLGLGIGLRDPWPSDEPRFALVAQWMVEHGQWLFPHRGHELYPDKPPVFMWLQALSYYLTHHWRIAFLLPSLLAALGALALVYDLARRLWNHRSALLAAATLLVTIHFTYQMRNAQIDPLLLGWITLANYGLLRHLLLGPSWRWFAVGCFFAGLGVATKGVGVLALLMLLPYLVARRGHWRQLALPVGGWRWAGGLALFFVPILGWLLPMLLVAHADGDPQHAAYVQNILFGQTVHRYATPTGHLHSPFYFLGIIVVDWLPLSLLLPWALPAWWRRLQRRDARFLLPLGWIVLMLLFFSFSPGKRDVYILPALPMTALALAPLLPGLLRRRGVRLAVCALTVLLAGALTAAAALAIHRHPAWAVKIEQSLDPQIWWMLLAIGAAGLVIVALTRVRRAPLGWLLFAGVLWSVYGLWGYPMLNGDRSARDVMVQARAMAGPDATIGLLAWKEQNLLMAAGPVAEFGFLKPWPQQYAEAIAWQRQDPAHRWIFSLDEAMGACVDRHRATYVGHANRREWWMFQANAVVPGCVPGASADPQADDTL
ncbi:ArnT family glycosyltransferase [Rhodanobacter denitrificans]|uniref:PMT family glycosyltransferase, 4-amino-4-deoxy-L-arabinose transferase n=1 Tax=Rhodanobacter denitrificans TaxID=666685 RepID=M4NTE0_9GAMM|nr:glycosyltransferase family 39 protein [Rhodanobacter denitrificans]AGG90756.1 PMT family glycosyltransferase, 4-amino-4-deoxy-L-arabinose transferase [Rhodanobacter denitrificans]UJM86132.1 glycosyltransferase family 39 protein [Rhodanobacter denitrificans]